MHNNCMTKNFDILSFRKSKGMSQADLAGELGVNQSTVHRWETGAVDVPAISIKALKAVESEPHEPMGAQK